ncbi:MAG: Crp/Fnr family transcriptional regulator [Deltaproteobacteria bacterium]|nr:Crp/Fnr family transcriptional regulator [Deltaproteobacteria bacterium]
MISNEIAEEFKALFPRLQGKVVDEILRQAEQRSFKEGSVMYEEGFPCPMVPFVLKGVIRVYKLGENGREITLYRVEPGEMCILSSTCAISGNEPYIPAVAVAETDVEMLTVPAHEFRRQLNQHSELQGFVNLTLSNRLTEMMMVVDEVAFGRVDLRLADRLLRASEKSGDDTLEVTHADLAVELGSAREVVSRILKDFERKGTLRLGRGRIKILDRALLEQVGSSR